MYAYDTGFSSKISNALEINSELLPDFLKVCNWLKHNKLSLNIVKIKYMIIGTSQKLIQLGTVPKIKVTLGWVPVFIIFFKKYILFGGFWGCCCSSTVLQVSIVWALFWARMGGAWFMASMG